LKKCHLFHWSEQAVRSPLLLLWNPQIDGQYKPRPKTQDNTFPEMLRIYSNVRPSVTVFDFYLILPQLMSISTQATIVKLHLRHITQEEIATALRTGRKRISRCLPGTIPDSHCIGWSSICEGELIASVETRTLQTPSLSGVDLARDASEHLGLAIFRSTVNAVQVSASSPYASIGREPYCRRSLIL
jgi:hypothetical protein